MSDAEYIRRVETIITEALNGIIDNTEFRPISVYLKHFDKRVSVVNISVETKEVRP